MTENYPQHLYLASSFRGPGVAAMIMESIESLLRKPATAIKVSYITTAGNLHPKDQREWIDEGREILKQHGWQVFDYDIAGKSTKEVEQELSDKDVIFVQGGQCLYMLEETRKCNLSDNNRPPDTRSGGFGFAGYAGRIA